jgi:hypothetical protein
VCGDVGVCVEEGTQDVSSASSKFKDLSTIPWQEVNVIFLAALVGASTSSKLDILDSLAEKVRPGTIVVARSARGVRAVLYSVSSFEFPHSLRDFKFASPLSCG